MRKRFTLSSRGGGDVSAGNEWLAAQLGARFTVHDSRFNDFAEGSGVYRFFELFDVANVPNSKKIFELAAEKKIRLTPPPKPVFEEKMLFALLWNRNLQDFWRQELGEGFRTVEEGGSLHLARGPDAVAAARGDS